MQLDTTGDIVDFPGLFTLQPGQQRLVRVGSLTPVSSIEKAYRIFRGFSIGTQYALSDFRDRGQSSRISLYNNIRLNKRVNLSLNLSRSSQSKGSSINEIFIGFNYFFNNSSANLTQSISDKQAVTTLSLQKSPPLGEGFGYRFQFSPSEQQLPSNGILRYQAPFGIYELDYEHNSNGGNGSTLNASGSIVSIGNNIFFTRPVTDSYALIQVPGVRGVRGYMSNQEIGRTDSNGNLFIPNLLPYYGNNLRIKDEDIPLDYGVDANEKVVAPSFRGGAIVRFPVQRIQSLIGKISIESFGKTVIPVYGQLTVTVNAKEVDSPIGNQGEFYLENIPFGHYKANVEYSAGICTFDLNVPQSDKKIVDLGRLKCIHNSVK